MFDRIACAIALAVGTPWAFAGATLLLGMGVAAWVFLGFSEPFLAIFNLAISIVTALLVFVIQSSQNRDGAAIQVKLDELIHATKDARNEVAGIDRKTQKEIEEVRD